MQDLTATACEHNTMSARRLEGEGIARVWECDDCGKIRPMTAAQIDWARNDVPKCARCHHSKAYGPLMVRRHALGGETLLHLEECPAP